MTIKELKALLAMYPEDAIVITASVVDEQYHQPWTMEFIKEQFDDYELDQTIPIAKSYIVIC